jgi:hypothetical protein
MGSRETMSGEPADEIASVAELVSLLLEIDAVDEVAHEIQVGHPVILSST